MKNDENFSSIRNNRQIKTNIDKYTRNEYTIFN